ncbi:hypothetical protein AVEN_134898-1 [Araneus ventricosus]|uniref:Uncharacterized protein n=1 Tax=Araneus ventricosus TaxID=182803 RepID=A0A4Y2CIA0_ARAVE|nr:hypothetical protein AVEN_134898-1 [Araneus ventricosus]
MADWAFAVYIGAKFFFQPSPFRKELFYLPHLELLLIRGSITNWEFCGKVLIEEKAALGDVKMPGKKTEDVQLISVCFYPRAGMDKTLRKKTGSSD